MVAVQPTKHQTSPPSPNMSACCCSASYSFACLPHGELHCDAHHRVAPASCGTRSRVSCPRTPSPNYPPEAQPAAGAPSTLSVPASSLQRYTRFFNDWGERHWQDSFINSVFLFLYFPSIMKLFLQAKQQTRQVEKRDQQLPSPSSESQCLHSVCTFPGLLMTYMLFFLSLGREEIDVTAVMVIFCVT